MRAMGVTSYAEPLVPVTLPEPDVPAGYALLEVVTCGVCYSDVKTARGQMPYSDQLALPAIHGHEVYGRVLRTEPPGLAEVGSASTVFHYWPCGRCAACRRGDETLCSALVAWMGFTHGGGFAERIAVPVDRLIQVPTSIDPVHAAPLSCALGTAYRSVIVQGGVRPGTRVAILGLGGVGIHAAQIARAAGAQAVGFDVHDPTIEAARDLGLDAQRAGDPEAEAEVLSRNGGEGLDVVVDTVGLADTPPRFVLGMLELVGSRYAHRDDLERAVALVAAGLVRPIVGLVRPLEEVKEVFDALTCGAVVSRAVRDVAGGTA